MVDIMFAFMIYLVVKPLEIVNSMVNLMVELMIDWFAKLIVNVWFNDWLKAHCSD